MRVKSFISLKIVSALESSNCNCNCNCNCSNCSKENDLRGHIVEDPPAASNSPWTLSNNTPPCCCSLRKTRKAGEDVPSYWTSTTGCSRGCARGRNRGCSFHKLFAPATH